MLTNVRQVLLICAVGVLAVAGLQTAARADWGSPVGCDAAGPNPSCIIYAASPGSPGSGSGGTTQVTCHSPISGEVEPCYITGLGWLGSDNCYYQVATAAIANRPIPPAKPGPASRWYFRTCIRLQGMTGFVWVLDANAPGPAQLARFAESLMVLPHAAIELSPPTSTMQLVGAPTWLWLPAASFTAQHASVQVPGTVVTARANPTIAVWRTGDGAVVTCRSRGTEWTTQRNPTASSPTCGHTYTRTSAGQPHNTFTLTVTVIWRITWTGTGGAGGTLPNLVTTSTAQIPVGQAQTVITH